MKRITAFLVALIMVMTISVNALAAAVTPEFSGSAVTAGDDVTVTLKLDEKLEDISSLEYYLYFDSALFTLKSSTIGDAHSAMKLSNMKTEKKTGRTFYSINFVNTEEEGQTINAGTLYTLVFTAKEDITEKQDVVFNLVSNGVYTMSSDDPLDVPVTVETTTVTINPKPCDHKWSEGEVTTEPTCTEAGVKSFACTVEGCDGTKAEVVPALGHTDEDKDFYCDVCKEDLCTKHTEEVVEGKAATCTETGLTEGKKCSVCGEVLLEQEEIAALGHKEETVPGKAATCTEAGLTEGKKCSVCGETVVAQEEIPALGHTEEVIPGKGATCTETGLTEGKKCSVCGETLVEQEEIPALGHTDEDNNFYCDVCDEKLADEPSTEVPDTPEKPEGNKNWWNGIKNFFDKIFGNHGGDDDSDDSTQQPETPEQPEVPETPEKPVKPNYGFGWIGNIINNWFGKWWK